LPLFYLLYVKLGKPNQFELIQSLKLSKTESVGWTFWFWCWFFSDICE